MDLGVLVVDDEPIVRIGLRTVVPWEEYGFHIAGEASNGLDGLKLAEVLRPEIIIADILMPGMDGFEFISRVRKILPESKIIVLSCKDNVESYRQAIRLGVSAYVQKSTIEAKELKDILSTIREELEGRYNSTEHSFPVRIGRNREAELNELFNSIIEGRLENTDRMITTLDTLGIGFCKESFYFIIVRPEGSVPSGPFAGLCSEIVEDASIGHVFQGPGKLFSILMAVPPREDTISFLEYLGGRIKDTVEQVFDFSVDIGVSTRQRTFDKIENGYREAVAALDQAYLKGKTRVHFYRQNSSEERIPESVLCVKETILKLNSLKELSCAADYLESMRKTLAGTSVSSMEIRALYLDLLYHFIQVVERYGIDLKTLIGTNFNPIVFVEEPETLDEVHKKFLHLLRCIANYENSHFINIKKKLTTEVDNYITCHVKEKIILKAVADYVHFSPSYVSRVYKEVKGFNITDMIHKEKIESSKTLLSQGISLESVAEILEFSSVSHFIRIFKALTGNTPKQFLKNELGNTSKASLDKNV